MKISFNHPVSLGRGTFVRPVGTTVSAVVALPEIREMLGLTAAELAAKLSVSPRTVEGWEQGREISLDNFIALRGFIKSKPKLKRL